MKNYLRLTAIAILGFFAPLWCSWGFKQVSLWIYIAAGAPLRPSLLFSWATVLGVSLAFGLMIGAINCSLLPERVLKAWSVFWLSLLLGSTILGVVYGAPEAVVNLLKSPGTWSFAFGSALPPMVLGKLRMKKRAAEAA